MKTVDTLTVQHRKNTVFNLMLATALAGKRCPMNDQLPEPSSYLTLLCRDGRLKVEVFDKNWRVVTILEGPHAGKNTASPPAGRSRLRPYVTIDKNGTYRNGKLLASNHRGAENPVTLSFKDGKRDREVF